MTSSDDNKRRRLLVLHEGVVPYAYQDSEGYLTIGVGHLIDRRKGGTLPVEIIWLLLEYDIRKKEEELDKALPWSRDLDPVRRTALLDMAFNLGVDGLLGFRNTLHAIQEQRWGDAADGMLASKWAGQVGRRAVRLAEMMRSGQWPAVLSATL